MGSMSEPEGHLEAPRRRAGDTASMRALAVTVSNRAAAGVYEDRSGPVLAELLRSAGCAVDGPVVITSCLTSHGNCGHTSTCTVREPLRRVNS